MIHLAVAAVSGASAGGGGGIPPSGGTVSFSPDGGTYAGTSISVLISITGGTAIRWKIGAAGVFTTVNATSTTVSVPLASTGKTLSANALNSNGDILAGKSANYFGQGGGQ